jgi:hypothetical protein
MAHNSCSPTFNTRPLSYRPLRLEPHSRIAWRLAGLDMLWSRGIGTLPDPMCALTISRVCIELITLSTLRIYLAEADPQTVDQPAYRQMQPSIDEIVLQITIGG